MDACWDCLTDLDPPATIYVKGRNSLPKALKKEQEILEELLQDLEQWRTSRNRYLHVVFSD